MSGDALRGVTLEGFVLCALWPGKRPSSSSGARPSPPEEPTREDVAADGPGPV